MRSGCTGDDAPPACKGDSGPNTPEYDRLLSEQASRYRVESELEARVRRVNVLHVHEVDPKIRARLLEAWKSLQARFAEDPTGTLAEAERLVREAMEARGYEDSQH